MRRVIFLCSLVQCLVEGENLMEIAFRMLLAKMHRVDANNFPPVYTAMEIPIVKVIPHGESKSFRLSMTSLEETPEVCSLLSSGFIIMHL